MRHHKGLFFHCLVKLTLSSKSWTNDTLTLKSMKIRLNQFIWNSGIRKYF